MIESLDGIVKKLIEKGKEQGYLTYEEMNKTLPDEATGTQLDLAYLFQDLAHFAATLITGGFHRFH
jgi:hypothetical protein